VVLHNHTAEETGYDRHHSTASTLLVAIDISKHRHEVLIGIPGKKRRRRLTITNTLDDFPAPVRGPFQLRPAGADRVRGNRQLSPTLAHHLGRAGSS
jgi:hypothetical protein